MAIVLTERAAEEVKNIIKQRTLLAAEIFLRVGVRGGGCSGLNYSLDLTEQADEGDAVTDSHGVRVLCDPKSLPQLDGTTIDFRDGVMDRGFVFANPNATKTCGCGSSFCT